MSARLFLFRWNLRILRQEWSQYFVLFLLITISTGLGIAGVLSAYNLVEPPENRFGKGDVIATVSGETDLFEEAMIEQGHPFGIVTTGVVELRGQSATINVKVQDPANLVTAPLVSLLDGRWPISSNEVALTNEFGLSEASIGQVIELVGNDLEVVGLVENPTNLDQEFMLTPSLDDLAIPKQRQTTLFLVDAKPEDVTFPVGVGSINLQSREFLVSARTGAALAVNAVSAIAMLEVALLVGAGFAVIARRRSRQYGLLASVGATPAHIRSAAGVGGTILGLVGGLVGASVGLGVASAVTPFMETTVGHRIDLLVPWWAIVPNIALAVLVSTVAARWPARPLSKMPVVHLLASFRPKPTSVGRSTTVGVVLAVVGAACLGFGFAQLNTALATVGILFGPIGLLLMSPVLVGAIGIGAARFPVSARLAGRSIARHNRRSASVVAALAIALAIPIGLTVVSTSIDDFNLAQATNLEENTFIAWVPGANEPQPQVPVNAIENPDPEAFESIAEAQPNLDTVPIQVVLSDGAIAERETFDSIGPQSAILPYYPAKLFDAGSCVNCDIASFGDYDSNGDEIEYNPDDAAWIGTPELLETLGIDQSVFDGSVSAIATSSEWQLAGYEGIEDVGEIVVEPLMPINSSIPSLLLSPDFAKTRGYETATVGLFAKSDGPISVSDQDKVSTVASSKLAVEFFKPPTPQSTLRSVALLLGLLTGLGIAVSAVSLFTSESADDLRILKSIGASPKVSRHLSASVAAILAAAGSVVAVFIGYLALIPLLTVRQYDLPFVVPWVTLVGFMVLFPLLAAGAGWVLSGRQTTGLARQS